MSPTPKLADALRHLSRAPNGRLTRAHRGFGFTGSTRAPLITRRTGNALVCAGLADYNDRILPSVITLTDKGLALARQLPSEPLPTGADVAPTTGDFRRVAFGAPSLEAA